MMEIEKSRFDLRLYVQKKKKKKPEANGDRWEQDGKKGWKEEKNRDDNQHKFQVILLSKPYTF